MTKDNRDNIEEQDILEEAEQEIEEIENNEGEIDEEKLDEAMNPDEEKTKEVLARTMADFENFKKRTLRDRDDMVFFIKQDILKKILPRIDDIQRILKDTPDEFKQWPMFEWLESLQKKLISDLDNMWVASFDSIWNEVNPYIHDVITTIDWKESWIIFDEFEKGYYLWDRVLRHAKVVVGV